MQNYILYIFTKKNICKITYYISLLKKNMQNYRLYIFTKKKYAKLHTIYLY